MKKNGVSRRDVWDISLLQSYTFNDDWNCTVLFSKIYICLEENCNIVIASSRTAELLQII